MVPETQIGAAEFKAKCLQLLDAVAKQGTSLTITKHGRPVARVVPIEHPKRASMFGGWEDVRITGDIVNCDTSDEWDAMK
ncbi:MAG TPA: type II toxin-antitoxin system prevent-host-death family antitoxin [Bryobacteraceae bacterium]|nr:type II toxin-antitoxin system prevent-host-death family antitoxin [Bryobacteraceae bacterium]